MPPSTPPRTTVPTADDVRRWSSPELAQHLKPRILLESGLPEEFWAPFEALKIDGATFLDHCNIDFIVKQELFGLASPLYQQVRAFGGPYLAPTSPTADDVLGWSSLELAQYLKPRLLESRLPEKYWPRFEELEIDGATFLNYCNMTFMAERKVPLLLASRLYRHVRSFGGPFRARLAAAQPKQ